MNTKKDIPPNDIPSFVKEATLKNFVKEATLKNVNFLALGKQNTNTQPPNKKNSSYNGENKIDEKFAKEYLEKKQQQPQTTYIIANFDELSKIKGQTEANLKTPYDMNFLESGRE